ncbi:hypothetical protein [Brevundimonas sp.]|uniref:hypothetical protein n=1 Tax=Brevundimonas sp. TaxID=1871086 RepID=UPI001D2AC25B|nr:hypothetical protein [Brevundimonas sp.]MBL0946733.1 hypothetical protein [Brevundimonas sp.]
MRVSEAKWIRGALKGIDGPILNLGSSTKTFREDLKPHIDREVFSPLRADGVEVVHADMKQAPGVDLVGDITDPVYQEQLVARHFRAILVSNLLEHVRDPGIVADACRRILPEGGLICVTGPYRYPYHADPIDTMYRPTPEEFASLFKGELVVGEIIDGGTLRDDVRSLPHYLAQSGWRILNWPRRPKAARARASALTYLFRPFEISCAVIRIGTSGVS